MMGEMAGMNDPGMLGTVVSILKYIAITLGGGAVLGLIGGLVFAGIRYPNPDKQALFSAKQKIIVLIVFVLGVALILAGFFYKPKSSSGLGEDIMAMAMRDDMGMPSTNELGLVLGKDGAPLVDDAGLFRNAMGQTVDDQGNPVGGAVIGGADGGTSMAAGDAAQLPGAAVPDAAAPPDTADASGATADASGAASGATSDAASGTTSDAAADAPTTADAPTGGSVAGGGGGGGTAAAGGTVIIGGGSTMIMPRAR